MINDEILLREAADTIHALLREYLLEPNVVNEMVLLETIRHYLFCGVRINLKKDGAVIIHQSYLPADSFSQEAHNA
jgi:hypothetical protein